MPQPATEATLQITDTQICLQPPAELGGKPLPLAETLEQFPDIHEEVKEQLALKISRLIPGLAEEHKQVLLDYTFRVLLTLAKDQADKVRQMIAQEIKDSPHVPHELVAALAWDNVLEVAAPVLEYSPLLTDNDLLEIIGQSKLPGAVTAVAKRTTLPEKVSDAIVKNGDDEAIAALLANHGAAIGEETLDYLAGEAVGHESWHAPLALRPELSMRAMNRIAGFMSTSLLESLQAEGKLAPRQGGYLQVAVQQRLKHPSLDEEKRAEHMARELHALGLLDAERVADALACGEVPFTIAAIIVLSGLTREVVQKILKSGSAKGVTALAWKAGLSMRTALQMQLRIAKIHHTQVLNAKGGFDYPLTPKEMEAYLELFL